MTLANLTGRPTVVVPDGTLRDNTTSQPGAVTFTGKLFGEAELLALAHAYQPVSGAHLRRPPFEELLEAKQNASPPSSE